MSSDYETLNSEEQGTFISGRGCIDQNFMLRQIREKNLVLEFH